ncbi:MAG TPA: peptidoglycan DD-metalloendopeptidase family protein [Prolixibacteraceae bacterium]|nr:peptidoglycan DD-metalloendopeptidase family protein [Prolixibacteraceae bacterium]
MRFFVLLFALLLIGSLANGQSLDELRKKKQKTNDQIKQTTKLLEATKKNQAKTLNKFKILSKQIELRTNLINGINSEVTVLSGFIDQNAWLVASMNNDLEELKKEYAQMILFAQKNQTSYDKLVFILSANSFNQAYKRFMYLKHYTEYRKRQAELIEWIRDLIQAKVSRLQLQKAEKEVLMESKKQENQKLSKEKQQQGQYLTSLQKKQKEFERKLKEQQQIEAQLSREIQRIIEEEVRKAREREKERERREAAAAKASGKTSGKASGKTSSKTSGTPRIEMTPEEKLASDKFEQNRRRLPWPVERGVITDHFGVHEHPVLKNIQVKNNGVDISTNPGMRARAVFAGEVSRVFMVTGGNMAVIIRHGKYLTVYSNLVNVQVKQGEKVTTKQTIGTIGTDEDEDSKTVLKFQIWRENEKMDPEDWIAR